MTDDRFDGSHRVLRRRPLNAEVRPEALWQAVTPGDRFFIRSNFPLPSGTEVDHRLVLSGAVARRVEWSPADLTAMPSRTLEVTTECAGNGRTGLAPTPLGEPWRLGAVGTARWTGVPLRDLLRRGEPAANAVEVLFRGADAPAQGETGPGPTEFARSLPIERAMHPDTLVAFAMNGNPIPKEHGAPLRLIVPGWYGMASVKWLAAIEVLEERFTGYFQQDRYRYEYADGSSEPVTTIRVRSLITDPVNNGRVPLGRVRIRGRAWSGEGPVTRVEVAVEGGDDWHEAALEPSASPWSWSAWYYDWEADRTGLHVLRSRATDASGAVQPHTARWNRHGYGNNAVQRVFVEVT